MKHPNDIERVNQISNRVVILVGILSSIILGGLISLLLLITWLKYN